MKYEEWNEALAAHFFNAMHAGRRVYLHTTAELLAELSGLAKGAEADFVAAVKAGPAGCTGSLCRRALAAASGWKDRTSPPPWLAHLCLFSMAAGREGNWAAHAYYARLWDLLQEEDEGTPPNFHEMQHLWRDLECWTHVDLADSRGRFSAQAAGGWPHVGLPIAQLTLNDAERRALPSIFEAADLEPGVMLPVEEVASAVANYAGQSLRRRTMQHLAGSRTSDFRVELVAVLQAELAAWDGRLPAVPARGRSEQQRAGLRIWLREIDPAGFVASRLVARVPQEGDIADLIFADGRGNRYVCPGETGHMTGALQRADNGEDLDAASLSWIERVEMKCTESPLRLVLPLAEVRVFTEEGEGMKGLVEAKVIPASGRFMVAASARRAARIEKWGREWCAAWEEQRVSSGLPAGWRLFRGSGAKGDGGLAAEHPIFARPVSPRVRFEGGIRSGGSRYFPFALPRILVEWAERPQSVTCEGVALSYDAEGAYSIPPDAVKPVSQIAVHFAGMAIHEYLYVVSDGWQWGDGSDCLPANGYGLAPGPGDPELRGADVRSSSVPEFVWDPYTARLGIERGIWIGRIPGQIADLRRAGRVPDWAPVWIVGVRRGRLTFFYCGFDLSLDQAVSSSESCPAVKKWRAVVWGGRRRTDALANARQALLLQQYREVAHAL